MNSLKDAIFKSAILVAAVTVGQVAAQTSSPTALQTPPAVSKESSSATNLAATTISSSGPRPLQRAIEGLRLKYGWAISYEDPKYTSAKDLKEDPNTKGNWLPAGTDFHVEVPSLKSPTDPGAEEKSLQLIVDAYNHSGNPGQFELRKLQGNGVTVVGVAARNDKGEVAPQKPLLDSSITVAVKKRTIEETLNLVCKVLGQDTHVPASIGITPRSLVDHTNVTAGGTKISARVLLEQALAASGHPLYWQLLFDPNTKSYLLNIHSVRPAKPPTPEIVKKPPTPDAHP